MEQKQLSISPQLEVDGSYKPSEQALAYATSDVTNYEKVDYTKYQGSKSKILIIFTEQKNMTMQNGKMFSTGNHPVEALLPMLHLKNAGFEFEIVTPTGRPVIFEMWAMPQKDENVMGIYNHYKVQFENPGSLQNFVDNSIDKLTTSYGAVFIPGGHGAMLGIPQNENVAKILKSTHQNSIFTITICHGPGALLSTTLDGGDFLYEGYKMTVFPDAMDKETPKFGYLPGEMPWRLGEKLTELGVVITNAEMDDSCVKDRELITGASPLAGNSLGKLATTTLLKELK
ncbi:glyoxalase III HchA [Aquimarina litoralis]|uniref:glyoxalase III HchA n=1 Tax=Aquimarina litoralis TaxID=584605 RepID=UPI001C565412|nr:glyoxalase III HchA [Aquimarina litoralis]MBW1296331.1 protein deglycase HchA [Aquimarina litoralis]